MKAKHKPGFDPVNLPDSNVRISNIGKYQYAYHIGKWYRTKSGMLLHNPVTKRQRTIFEQFGFGKESIAAAFQKHGGTNEFFDS